LERFNTVITFQGPAERRDRLRALLSEHQKEGLDLAFDDEMEDQDEDDDNEEFYSYGPEELQPCRQEITKYSRTYILILIHQFLVPRAKARLETTQRVKTIPPSTQKKVLGSLYSSLRQYDISASQFGDTRPLCAIRFSPCSQLVATGSFSGPVKLWNAEGAGSRRVFKGHRSRTTSIDFNPNFTQDCLEESSGGIDMMSCGIDGSVLAWNANSSELPVAQFIGHDDIRVSRVAFHPSGDFIATARYLIFVSYPFV
jgi:U4/U6 small nuclear ribonucleoprotein PRP4